MRQAGCHQADQTNTDIAALQAEVGQLRDDIAKIAGTMRDIAGNGVVEAGQQLHRLPGAGLNTSR